MNSERERVERRLAAILAADVAGYSLTGSAGLFRLRVGDYRVLYSVDEAADTVAIELIRCRGDVYKR